MNKVKTNPRKKRQNKKHNSLKKLKQSRKKLGKKNQKLGKKNQKLGKKNQKGGFRGFESEYSKSVNADIDIVLKKLINEYNNSKFVIKTENQLNRNNIVTHLIQSHGGRPCFNQDVVDFKVPKNATIFFYTPNNCPYTVHEDGDDIYLVHKLDILFKEGYGKDFLELVEKFVPNEKEKEKEEEEREYTILQTPVSIHNSDTDCPNIYFGGGGSNETRLVDAGLYIFDFNNATCTQANPTRDRHCPGWSRGSEEYNFLEANKIPNHLEDSKISLEHIVTTISNDNKYNKVMNYFHIMTCRCTPTSDLKRERVDEDPPGGKRTKH